MVLPFNGGLALVGGLEPFVADGLEGVDDGVGEAEVEVLGGGVGADAGFDACGFGGPGAPSTKHIRQLPAMDSRSW